MSLRENVKIKIKPTVPWLDVATLVKRVYLLDTAEAFSSVSIFETLPSLQTADIVVSLLTISCSEVNAKALWGM